MSTPREPSANSGVGHEKSTTHEKAMTHDFRFIPIPRRLRYDAEKPFHFGLLLNVLFGFASTFIVANLYYCQPLLIQFSESFGVDYNRVARIPTLLQAGYATGIVLISPLGDLVRRRQLIILLALISASLTIGLAITPSLVVFEVLSFLIGVVSVTPQILIPLAADLAPPERRAAALSVVFSGLLFGILVARVIAGIIAQFTSWRVVYYFAIGVQYLVLVASYFVIPDYPAKNTEMTYWGILRTMARFAYTEPILIQACLVNLASCACFTNFWVTLTFLLGGPPYFYSTLTIGLFGLIGIFGVACGPLVGRAIDRLIPWYASLAAVLLLLCFQAIQVAAGDTSVAAVVVAIMGLDVFRQMLQMSLATSVFSISSSARARLNAVFVLSLFIGQLMGTAAGTEVFTTYGWRPAAALNMGLYVWILGVIMLRGPHCARFTWFGFEGGWEARKSVVDARNKAAEEEMARERETSGEKGTCEEGGREGVDTGGSTTPRVGDLEKGGVDRPPSAVLEMGGVPRRGSGDEK
ncbi:major facilitator superfamily domain-containing protein [Mycena rosella]|uniref:Major facilitator superfamily domain-containing protein n=1 Tax=Mycena rosella TaxID=1033263 RepID=A0AAD7CR48_MYCRO|nr:major facilitator superfamily domain-containing protein [Mycena rosella]